MAKPRILFIFDWDDTLFPTHWVVNNRINVDKNNITDRYILHFVELDNRLSKLLMHSSMLGTILIVTNATKDWVVQSSGLLPKSYKVIERVATIISARELYQDKFEMPDWKIRTFNYNLINYVGVATQIITIGDSDFEHKALASLSKPYYVGKKLKAIRFSTNPSYEVLMDQLEVLTNSLSYICSQNKHMDLSFKAFLDDVQGVSECNNFWDYGYGNDAFS